MWTHKLKDRYQITTYSNHKKEYNNEQRINR